MPRPLGWREQERDAALERPQGNPLNVKPHGIREVWVRLTAGLLVVVAVASLGLLVVTMLLLMGTLSPHPSQLTPQSGGQAPHSMYAPTPWQHHREPTG